MECKVRSSPNEFGYKIFFGYIFLGAKGYGAFAFQGETYSTFGFSTMSWRKDGFESAEVDESFISHAKSRNVGIFEILGTTIVGWTIVEWNLPSISLQFTQILFFFFCADSSRKRGHA